MALKEVIARSIGTHDGTFHADEVTACALLVYFNLADEAKVFRSRDPEKLSKCEFVCDVGGIYDPARKLFDHHQNDYTGEKSSAGLILDYLLQTGRVDHGEYHLFNHKLVIGVDDHDNGRAILKKGYASFSHIISNFTPIDYEASPEEQDKAFHEALKFVIGHLKRLYERYHYDLACREEVEKAMCRGTSYLIFEKPIPWLENFFDLGGKDHPASFVVMPSGNSWKVRGIPPDYERRMEVRIPLPKEWAGLMENDLKKVSGIQGAIFCHKGRFISVWETRELKLAKLKCLHSQRILLAA